MGICIRLSTGILESYYRDLYRGVCMSCLGTYTVVFRSTVMGIYPCIIRFTYSIYRELFLISAGGRKTWLFRLVRWEQYTEIIHGNIS